MADGLFSYKTPGQLQQDYLGGLIQPVGGGNLYSQLVQTMSNAGRMMGYGAGRMFGGQVPGEERNAAIQSVFEQVKDIQDPTQQYTAASQLFLKAGFPDLAMQARKTAQTEQLTGYQLKKAKFEADEITDAPVRRRAALEAKFPTLDEKQIISVANNKELFQTYMTPIKPGETEIKKVGVADGTQKPVYVFKQGNDVSQVVAETDAQGKQSFIPYSGAVDQTTAKQTVNVSPEGKGLSKEQEALAASRVKSFDEARSAAQSATSQLRVLRGMRNANRAGKIVYSGPQAGIMVGASSFLQSIGMLSDEGAKQLASAEKFDKDAKDLVFMELGGKLGAQVSDADRKFIEDRIAQLSTSPKAREEVLAKLEEIQQRKIDRYQDMEAYLEKNKTLRGYNFIKQPDLPKLAPTTVFSSKTLSAMTDEELAAAAAKLKE